MTDAFSGCIHSKNFKRSCNGRSSSSLHVFRANKFVPFDIPHGMCAREKMGEKKRGLLMNCSNPSIFLSNLMTFSRNLSKCHGERENLLGSIEILFLGSFYGLLVTV